MTTACEVAEYIRYCLKGGLPDLPDNANAHDIWRLMKMTYLAFREYAGLCGQKMFRDPILAYTDGPCMETLRKAWHAAYDATTGTHRPLGAWEVLSAAQRRAVHRAIDLYAWMSNKQLRAAADDEAWQEKRRGYGRREHSESPLKWETILRVALREADQ